MINYSATTSQDLALRYMFPRANIQATGMDHDYLQIPFTEYWVDSALEVEDAEILEKSTDVDRLPTSDGSMKGAGDNCIKI